MQQCMIGAMNAFLFVAPCIFICGTQNALQFYSFIIVTIVDILRLILDVFVSRNCIKSVTKIFGLLCKSLKHYAVQKKCCYN